MHISIEPQPSLTISAEQVRLGPRKLNYIYYWRGTDATVYQYLGYDW